MLKEAYTTRELASILGFSQPKGVLVRANRESWQARPRVGRGGGNEWLVSTMPEATRTALVSAEARLVDQQAVQPTVPTLATAGVSDAKRKKALARADLVVLYSEWIAKAEFGSKAVARDSFIQAYKGGAWPHLLETLGVKASWKSIERWKLELRKNGTVVALVDRRGAGNEQRAKMTEEHAKLLLNAVLQPNHPTISTAIRMATSAMTAQKLPIPAERTMRRFLSIWKETNFGTWVYTREGKKAWNDKAAFYIERDYNLIEVGDILVADGHVLNFETLNPWTGKPQRMELIMWYDMKSNCPMGWEIMPTENTQGIAAAFRRAVMTLGKFPLIAYLDNGRAFRSKYFNGVDFRQTGIAGLFQDLGIHTIFAWPYHGQSKTIERFFGTLHELEQWVPSYVGNNIAAKPARLNRGEPLHRKAYDAAGGRPLTLEETHYVVAQWIDEYIQRPQRGHLNGKTPAEVFMQGRGAGVDESKLRHLMMAKAVRQIRREGIRFLGERYYDGLMHGRTHAVQIKYDLHDRSSILVFSEDGSEFICKAQRQNAIHPAASLLGTDQHREELQQAITLKKDQERDASSIARQVLEDSLAAQRDRMVAIQNEKIEPKKVADTPLSQSKVLSIESAKKKAQTQRSKAPSYVPPVQKPEIVTELDKYDYLFGLSVKDGVVLREPDSEWMEQYESTEEYVQDAAPRYERLRKYYGKTRQCVAQAN
ncbi:Mu transposase C-terminal domain-containing protein [Halodesulfovibrio aestuarii]|uniref:Putative transposase n=1 Tax=Halodesulfovibrio aestuarii TaxID=126333 RepID=A0A8G2C835_9BACT|nr:Mu transposase C-terminal domain-containing protein [Halodesulfovibrio aestuarii]SHI74948.1 putative transposase [Halodesulfovibrio aestuarii]